MTDYNIEPAQRDDLQAIRTLLCEVAAQPGGLARAADEISADYVRSCFERSLASGIMLVSRPAGDPKLAGAVHAYAPGTRAFAHVLGDLTIAVNAGWQGRGVGRALLGALVQDVSLHRPHVQRIELMVRESNRRAIALYEDLGFCAEGRLASRIVGHAGQPEADVPMAWIRSNRP